MPRYSTVIDCTIGRSDATVVSKLSLRGIADSGTGTPVMVSKVHRLPPELRAFGSYLLSSGDVGAIPMALLQRKIDGQMDEITERIFHDIERELDRATKRDVLEPINGTTADGATFSYDTRLLLPAMITYGHLRTAAGDVPIVKRLPGKRINETLAESARETTYSITQALLDGDMRDAINDDEFTDFETNRRPKQKVATIAQRHLQSEVTAWLDSDGTPESVARHYDHAVTVSEAHQDDDPEFRALFDRLKRASSTENNSVVEEIRNRYKFAEPKEDPTLFSRESSLPYFTTQYERVGIIYEDMLGMYEGDVGIDLSAAFKRAVVLMVIAAQIGLDDTDDYPEDRHTQLTPVTAELGLASSTSEGVNNLKTIIETYLDQADFYASSAITRIAIEYIRQQSRIRIKKLQTEVAS